MKLEKLLIGVLMVAVLASCGKSKPEKEVVLNAVPTVTNDMPAFTATMIDNSTVSFKEVSGKALIVFFNPDCDHCQREALLMSQNKNMFSDYQVYFITIDQIPAIVQFQKDFGLVDDNFHFGRAEGPEIIKAVGQISEVPTFFAYENQKLRARVQGEVTLDNLKAILQ